MRGARRCGVEVMFTVENTTCMSLKQVVFRPEKQGIFVRLYVVVIQVFGKTKNTRHLF